MSDQNLTELGLSTGDAVQEVLRLSSALDQYADRLEQIAAASVTFSREGKLAAASVTALDASLRRTTDTFKDTKNGLQLVSSTISGASTRMKELVGLMNQLRTGSLANKLTSGRETAADAAARALTAEYQGPHVGQASTAEMKRFQAAVAAASNEIKRGNVGLAEYNSLQQRLAAGASDFTIREQGLVAKLKAVAAAANEFGDAAVSASSRAARASLAQEKAQQRVINQLLKSRALAANKAIHAGQTGQAVGIAQQTVAQAFGNKLSAATPQQVLAFNAAMARAYTLIGGAKVNLQQFLATLQNVKAGKLQTGLVGPLNQLQNALGRANNAFNTLGTTGAQAGHRIGLSVQGMVRLLETEVIFRTFAAIQKALHESVVAAQEFSAKIALIQTISQDAGLSATQWAAGLRQVSDELGSPIVDTASAAYDLLSNQVTRGAESFAVLRTALEFGRTTNASAQDSVNLLSSAVNSFHLGADGADRAARTFFTTIDLGRVTASELANSFGRTGTLAETLGVTLEETQAAISSMTRQGIKGNEAYTLLNNVFLKLIKPTETMRGFLNKLGYETGQDAIQSLGFTGVLRLLNTEFDGSTAKVAKYFDELRGARGALNLTGKGLTEFLNDLQQIQTSTSSYDVAKNIIANDPSTQLKVQYAQLKNIIINDFGAAVVKTTVQVLEALGGIKTILPVIVSGLKATAVTLAAAFAAAHSAVLLQSLSALPAVIARITVAVITATGSWAAFGAAVNTATFGIPALAAAITGAITAYVVLARQREETFRASNAQILADAQGNAQKLIDNEKELADKRHAAFTAGLDKSRQAVLGYFAALRAEYNTFGDTIKAKQDAIAESIGNTFDVLKGIVGRALNAIEDQAKTASDNARRAVESIGDAQRKAADELFQRNLRRAQQNQDYGREVQLVNNRVHQLQGTIDKAFASNNLDAGLRAFEQMRAALGGLSTEVTKSAVFGFKSSTRFSQSQSQENGKTGPVRDRLRQTIRYGQVGTQNTPRVNVEGTERAIAAILKEEVNFLKAIETKNKAIAQSENAKAASLKTQNATLGDSFKKLKDFSVLDQKGNVKEEYTGSAGRVKAQDELTTRQNAVLNDLQKAGRGIPEQLSAVSAFGDQTAKLHAQLADQRDALKAQTDNLATLEQITTAAGRVKESYDAAAQSALKIKAAVQAAHGETVALRTEAQALAEVIGRGVDATPTTVFGTRQSVQANRDKLNVLKTELANAVAEGGEAGAKRAGEALQKLEGLIAQVGRGARLNTVLTDEGGQVTTLGGAIGRLKTNLTDLSHADFKLGNAEAAYGRAGRQIEALNTQLAETPEKFKGMGALAAAAGAGVVSGLDPANESMIDFTHNIEKAVRALRELNGLKAGGGDDQGGGGGGGVEAKARGGRIGYFAGGGFMDDFFAGKFAKGTDRYPVMASRGEYMVNAGATRQFLPLLRAINSGKLSPVQGTGNTTVGDINITVQGGSTSDRTIKNIGDGLRRGLRSGQIRPLPQ